MARQKPRQRVAIRLIDEAEHVLNQYQKWNVKKNKTECINALIASWGSESSWKKMTMNFQPSLLEIVEKRKLEVQRTEINLALKKDTIVWNSPDLERCLYRDLKGTPRCRDPKPPLKTDDLREEICLACQQLRNKTLEAYRDYQLVQRAFRLGGTKIGLVVGLKQQLELRETERDDWKQRFQNETTTLQNKHHFMLKKRDTKIHDLRETEKQLTTKIGDLNLKNIQQRTRIKKLEAIIADPQKFEKLESENQTLKTTLEKALSERDSERAKNVELIRKKDQLSTELELAIQKPTHACMQKTITDAMSKPESLKTKNDELPKKPEITRNQEHIAITTTTTTTVKLPQPIEKEKKKPIMVKCKLDGKQKDMDIECQSCGRWKECKSYARAMGLY